MPEHLKIFLFLFFLFLLAGIGVVLTHPHGFFVLWLNDYHGSASDFFFKNWTYLGDGLAVAAVILVLFFLKRRHSYVLGVLGIALLLVSSFLKKVVFGKVPRPAKYFEDDQVLNFVEGVKMHHWHSFPSGHTMTAFVLAGFLGLMIRMNYRSVILLLMATLVGISRIYLNQHFLVDVLAGGLIGLVLAMAFYRLFKNYLEKDFLLFDQKG